MALSSSLNPQYELLFTEPKKSMRVGQGEKSISASKDVRKVRLSWCCNLIYLWWVKEWKQTRGGKWKQPPCAMALLRYKTVSALKGKLLFLTGQILSGSIRGGGCNREFVLDYQRSWKVFWCTTESKQHTWRRSQHKMTGTPLGGLLSQLGWRMQHIKALNANGH